MLQDIIFLLIGIAAAVICLANGMPNLFTVLCSFLPVLISMIIENIERINLFLAKLFLLNSTISIDVGVKNTFISKNVLYDDSFFKEEKFKALLIENNVSVGSVNNVLRIEGNQKVSLGKDKEIIIKVPILVFFQFDGESAICTLKNSTESIAYRDICEIIRSIDSIWDFINDKVKDAFDCNHKNAFYEAKIKINTSKFKDVYLKSYAKNCVGDIELNRNNAKVKLSNEVITISSNSESCFEKAIKKYSGLFANFFKEEG